MFKFVRSVFKSRAADVEGVEAAVLPGSGDVVLRYPGEGVPRIISAETAQAITDAVTFRRAGARPADLAEVGA